MGTKAFPTGDVLSAVTGYLITPNGIGGIYGVLNWMIGESVYTHQIPRIGREAGPVLLAAHPELAEVYAEAKQVNKENWQQWLAIWTARYGETITVPQFTADEHARIEPLSELAEKVSPDRIIMVRPWPTSPNA